jgi:hypothetical protein
VTERSLEEWAQDICTRHGLRQREELRRTTHDLSDRLRNLIWDVEQSDRRAVLKVYDDDVVNVEAESLHDFHESNRSEVLTAPALYEFETTSLTKGWLLIEKLPDEAVPAVADRGPLAFRGAVLRVQAQLPGPPEPPAGAGRGAGCLPVSQLSHDAGARDGEHA